MLNGAAWPPGNAGQMPATQPRRSEKNPGPAVYTMASLRAFHSIGYGLNENVTGRRFGKFASGEHLRTGSNSGRASPDQSPNWNILT